MTLGTDIGWHGMQYHPPSKKGGLTIRSFQDVAKAMRMKMTWKLVTETSLWSTFFKQKYMQNIHPWYASKRLGCPILWTEIASVCHEINSFELKMAHRQWQFHKLLVLQLIC